MAWKNYDTYRKIVVKKNSTIIYEGEIKLISVDNTAFGKLTTDLNNGGGLSSNAGSWTYRTDPQYNTWDGYDDMARNAGDFGKSYYLYMNLTAVGDTLHFYGKDTGAGYGVRFRRIADDSGMRRVVVGFYNNGTLFEDSSNPIYYWGTDNYNRTRYLHWGIIIDPDANKAMFYKVVAAYHTPLQNYDSATYGFMSLSEAQLSTYAPAIFSAFSNVKVVTPDPYVAGDGPSAPVTPAGSYDNTSDTINIPSVPALNLSAGKLLTAYVPNVSDINDLADWLWQDFLTGSGISKLFADVMDSIISLHMLPFTPSSSTPITPTVGNFAVTGVSMAPLTAQFKDIDCGSVTFSEYWSNYLDYNPYTKITLFLPFVGEVSLDADEVMGESVSVKYRVDCLTGAFVAFVSTSTKVLGQFTGNCALSVPVSAADYSALHSAFISAAATAATGAGAVAAGAGMAGVAGKGALSLAANVDSMKVRVQHSGAIGNAAGFLGVQKPYAIIHRPKQAVPQYFNQFGGYPAYYTALVGDVYGYTEISDIKLDGLPFTDGELAMLDAILKGGVYL